jgi:uridine phosphorylase
MQHIGASELILNTSGAVYHLNLRPEDVAPIVITVGDPERVSEVSKYFDRIEFQTSHREFVTHTGYIGKKRLTVLSSGIGPDNIDIVMNELDACMNIDFKSRTIKENHTPLSIIRFGTSGSLQADIPVDSIVASSHGIGLDNLLHFYQFSASEFETNLANEFSVHSGLVQEKISPYAVSGSSTLLGHFKDHMHTGMTVTCPGFYAPQGRVVRAQLKFPQLVDKLSMFTFEGHRVTNFEMETSAIFGLGKIFGHQCLAINTIVANRISKTFSSNAASSIDRMIRKNLEIISQIQ